MIPGGQLPAGGKRNTRQVQLQVRVRPVARGQKALSASVSKSSESKIKGMTRNLETGERTYVLYM